MAGQMRHGASPVRTNAHGQNADYPLWQAGCAQAEAAPPVQAKQGLRLWGWERPGAGWVLTPAASIVQSEKQQTWHMQPLILVCDHSFRAGPALNLQHAKKLHAPHLGLPLLHELSFL